VRKENRPNDLNKSGSSKTEFQSDSSVKPKIK